MNRSRDVALTVALLSATCFSGLRRTVRKNLARLSVAFLALGVRFGSGGLHLTSGVRVPPEQVK